MSDVIENHCELCGEYESECTCGDTPRVYIAILADYNNGVLTGEWIDATDADTMRDEIARILRTSKYPNVMVNCPDCDSWRRSDDTAPCLTCKDTGKVASAEEYAIHDYDGFFNLSRTFGEYPDLDEVAHAAAMIEEHGEPWVLWATNIGDVTLTGDDFLDAYCGEYNSEEEYAEQLADDLGAVPKDAAWPLTYIDWQSAARDLFCGDYTFERGSDGNYVFRSC